MTYKIRGEVDAQHQLHIVLPIEIPAGPLDVIVELPETAAEEEELDLEEIIERHQFHSGIGDLAHQHDHYLYGTLKKEGP